MASAVNTTGSLACWLVGRGRALATYWRLLTRTAPGNVVRASNGLLRQYFPKSADLRVYHPEDLLAAAAQRNSRPRKTLD